MNSEKLPLFQRPFWVVTFALTAAIAWGWAYPLIKLGFQEFEITTQMTGSKMLFAGIRFCISGLIVLCVAGIKRKSFKVSKPANWLFILLFSLLNTTLHYAFFYIGLSHSEGARASIINSLSVFLVVILACIFFKSDRFTRNKLIGCIVGVGGILALNLGNSSNESSFSLLGDGMIILNAMCSAFASLMTRGLGKRVDIFVGTGYSLGGGGLLLVILGLISGGTLPVVTINGILILLALIAISTVGFTLYNKLISCNPVGKVAIFNSLIPVVGTITSCLCLSEPFYAKYIVSATLTTIGIYIINKAK